MRRKSRAFCGGAILIAFLLFSYVGGNSSAQDPSQLQDRAQFLRPPGGTQLNPSVTPNGEDRGYAAVSPNDPDLGEQQILKRAETYQPFRFTLASPFYYTSNVALTRRDTQGDFVVAPEVSLAYVPRITKTFFGEFTIRQQQFFYDRFSELNFGSFDVGAGIVYTLPQLRNLTLRARYNFNRLTNRDFDEIFSNHSLFFNAELPFPIGRAQQVVIGATTEISLYARPARPRRNDFEAYLGYNANVTRAISVGASVRVALRDYHESDRRDVSEIAALTANYQIRDWLSVGAISTFAFNQSNQSFFDYKVANIGGAVAVSIKF